MEFNNSLDEFEKFFIRKHEWKTKNTSWFRFLYEFSNAKKKYFQYVESRWKLFESF